MKSQSSAIRAPTFQKIKHIYSTDLFRPMQVITNANQRSNIHKHKIFLFLMFVKNKKRNYLSQLRMNLGDQKRYRDLGERDGESQLERDEKGDKCFQEWFLLPFLPCYTPTFAICFCSVQSTKLTLYTKRRLFSKLISEPPRSDPRLYLFHKMHNRLYSAWDTWFVWFLDNSSN